MPYSTAKDFASRLSSEDKLKLAHYLLDQVINSTPTKTIEPILPPSADYDYCLERILKSKPNKLPALRKFLEAIFSFRGGQTSDIEDIIKRLQLKKVIRIDGDAVTYLDNT